MIPRADTGLLPRGTIINIGHWPFVRQKFGKDRLFYYFCISTKTLAMTDPAQTRLHLPVSTVLHGEHYDYVIQQVLGQGSFGITYRAGVRLKGSLGEIPVAANVAIKEFCVADTATRDGSTLLQGSASAMARTYMRKFRQEALNLSKLSHPGIVKVMEIFEENSTAYYVMELIDGPSLETFLNIHGPVDMAECVTVIRAVCQAVSHMHSRNMLHLDIKPGNIVLRPDGTPVVIDFGLSKSFADDGTVDTRTTIGSGTSGYCPLEQSVYTGAAADGSLPATMDVYALGATMFRMLAGKRPPEASWVLNEGLPPQLLELCGELASIIEKAMDPIVRKRYQSVAELTGQLPRLPASPLNVNGVKGSKSAGGETAEPTEPLDKRTNAHTAKPFADGLYQWDELKVDTYNLDNGTGIAIKLGPGGRTEVWFHNGNNTRHLASTLKTDSIPDSVRRFICSKQAIFKSHSRVGLANKHSTITLSSSAAKEKTPLKGLVNGLRDMQEFFNDPFINNLIQKAFKSLPKEKLSIDPAETERITMHISLTASSTGPTPVFDYDITPERILVHNSIGFGTPTKKVYSIDSAQFKEFCSKLNSIIPQLHATPFPPTTDKFYEKEIKIEIGQSRRSDNNRNMSNGPLWRTEDYAEITHDEVYYPFLGGNIPTDIHTLSREIERIVREVTLQQANKTNPTGPIVDGRYTPDNLRFDADIDSHSSFSSLGFQFHDEGTIDVLFHEYLRSYKSRIRLGSKSIPESLRRFIGHLPHKLSRPNSNLERTAPIPNIKIYSTGQLITDHRTIRQFFTLPEIRDIITRSFSQVPKREVTIDPSATEQITIDYSLDASSSGATPVCHFKITPEKVTSHYNSGLGQVFESEYAIRARQFNSFCESLNIMVPQVHHIAFPEILGHEENQLKITIRQKSSDLLSASPESEILWRHEASTLDPQLMEGNILTDIHTLTRLIEGIIPKKLPWWKR